MARSRLRRTVLLGLVATAALGLTACAGDPPPGTGDPGNVRLHALQHDPMISALPPHSHLIYPIRLKQAYWDTTYGGWHGPGLTVQFTSSLTIQQVFDFYQAQARRTGWKPGGLTDYGIPNGWVKTCKRGAS